MTEEITPGLYRIEVPLPQNPLQAINSYVIKGNGRTLIVDTGMNRPECASVLRAGLEELKVDLAKADFFITHLHADHLGMVSSLANETSTVYFNKPDAEVMSGGTHWNSNASFAVDHGFPEDENRRAIESHPGRRYSGHGPVKFRILSEGDALSIGEYNFRCVATPGHTRGHMCLYEPKRKMFFSGDHILTDITPNISLWSDDENPLNEYLASLGKVGQMDIDLVLPGHRSIFQDCKGRIQELKNHHEERANEVLAILADGDKDAYQVASRMSWDIDYRSWDDFPPAQKWFAFGEAMSHLKYLKENGRVREETRGQKAVFTIG